MCCVEGEYDAIKSSTECSSEYPSLATFLGLCLLLTSIDNGFILAVSCDERAAESLVAAPEKEKYMSYVLSECF